jgi:transcription termination factor NusB
MRSDQLLFSVAIILHFVQSDGRHDWNIIERPGTASPHILSTFIVNYQQNHKRLIASSTKPVIRLSHTCLQSVREIHDSLQMDLRPKANARSVAVAALTEVSQRNNSISEPQYYLRKLEADPKFLQLKDQRDRSFARNLVGTTERRLGQIDKILQHIVTGYPPKKKVVQACLRVGVCQIVFLNIPPFAAVKETIDVLKMPGFHPVPYVIRVSTFLPPHTFIT